MSGSNIWVNNGGTPTTGDLSGSFAQATNGNVSRTLARHFQDAINIFDVGALMNGTSDNTAFTNFAAQLVALGRNYGAVIIRVPEGRTTLTSNINFLVPAGLTLIIEGIGQEASSIYFSNATDGLNITLQMTPGTLIGANVIIRDVSIIRGPTSPTTANTALFIAPDSTFTTGTYPGFVQMNDVTIRGINKETNQWNVDCYISKVSNAVLDNCNFFGIPATTADGGDRGFYVEGPLVQPGATPSVFSTGISFTNGNIIGHSIGLYTVGYIQGVQAENSNIIGQFISCRQDGVGAPQNLLTTSATVTGNILSFAAGSALNAILVNDIVNGTNIVAHSRVTAINYSTGKVTINNNVTGGGVVTNATVAFSRYYVAEAFNVVNCALNAAQYGYQGNWSSTSQVLNNSIIRFGTLAPQPYAAVWMNECNAVSVSDNPFIAGAFQANEVGVLFTSIGSQGGQPNTCNGNNITNIGFIGIHLQGTIAATVSVGNTIVAPTPEFWDIVGNNISIGNQDNYNLVPAFTYLPNTNIMQSNVDLNCLTIMRATNKFQLGSTSGPTITAGTGVPSATEAVGSIYMRVGGAAGAHLYVSQGGGTWIAVAGV